MSANTGAARFGATLQEFRGVREARRSPSQNCSETPGRSSPGQGLKLALAAVMKDSNLQDGTVKGFNRDAKPSPYPSLEETAKAQHIPKGAHHEFVLPVACAG
ncbi:hypothetical protein [Streptomyces sp. NPDC003006]